MSKNAAFCTEPALLKNLTGVGGGALPEKEARRGF
jgi:hypothetical protein